MLKRVREVAVLLKKYVPSSKWAPVRKVVAVAIASGLIAAARAVGLPLTQSQAFEIAQYVIPVAAGYLTKG